MIDAKFEDDSYLIEPDKIWAPKEVIAYFNKFKCLVCGSPLECEEPYVFRHQGDYSSYADCKEDCFHYEVSISWKDPKKIILNHEEIQFVFEKRLYKIKKLIIKHNENAILNDITINPHLVRFLISRSLVLKFLQIELIL